MTRIAVLGATGYTALELITILLRHPEAELTALTTRKEDRPHVASVHPSLAGRVDLVLENLSPEEVAERADCVFSCLPHAASASVIPAYLDAGCKVVDFSADYRLDDPAVFSQWYAVEHPDPARLPTTVYGLPELFREGIIGADLVANPGCYPTSAILALAPLYQANLITPATVIVDSKSGVSGAGRTPKPTTHFPECNESFSAYNLGKHRHTPEIELILGKSAKAPGRGDFLAAFGPDEPRHLDDGLCPTDPNGYRDRRFGNPPRVLRRRTVRSSRRRPSRHEERLRHELLPCKRTCRSRSNRDRQLHRQPAQRRLRRGGSEFQLDVRLRRNNGACVECS